MILLIYILLVLAGLPMLAYPFVLVANVMSLAAGPPGDTSKRSVPLVVRAFLWSSTLYPLVFIPSCLVALHRIHAGKPYEGLGFALIPILQLILILILFRIWANRDKTPAA